MTKKRARVITSTRVQNYWYRQGVIKYIFVLFLLGFGFRILTINQITIKQENADPISIQEKASLQANKLFKSKAYRGDIVDRNGDILASSRILKRVNLDPTQVQTAFIPKLAEALLMPENELRSAIEKKLSRQAGRKNLIIRKDLPLTDPILKNISELKKIKLKICTNKSIKDKVSLLDKALIFAQLTESQATDRIVEICQRQKISGVRLQTETQRYYPKSASLAPLLGRVNHDKQGVGGIEGEFEATLSGKNGITQLSLNQDSQGSYFNPIIVSKLEHGQNIALTIDAGIQYHAYAAIKKSVEKHQADSGSAIILAPNGEVLAMVNYPADDPNDRTIYKAEHYRNRVLSDKIEPGSTMKPFTLLLALDQKKISVTENECFNVTKRMKFVTRQGDYTCMTVKKILQKSHNQGTVIISEKLNKEDTYNTWSKLGFNRPVMLIPSIESDVVLTHFTEWSLADKRNLSYGYGPMNTNLAQLARAYLVFANDGAIPSLKLIKGVNTDKQMTQVFSKGATHKIADLLDAVVSGDGSGYRARIKGYNVAGKTGTAEMLINGSYSKKNIDRTFFTGFVPVKNPKYIMAVRLDYPKKCYNYNYPEKLSKCGGANSAAMVFKDAMENILTNDQSIKLLAKN